MATPFVERLTPAEAEDLRQRGMVRRFERGQALMHQGQVPGRVLLLSAGRVKVYSIIESGREVVLAWRGPGDLIRELSALDGEPRSASIVAAENVEAVVLAAQDFRGFLLDQPGAALALLEMLSERLRDADAKRIEYLAFNTMGRVALRIVEMAERFGAAQAADGVITLEQLLTQDELAAWASSSLESTGRALQRMREFGWIETKRREIRVLNLEAIRRAAE